MTAPITCATAASPIQPTSKPRGYAAAETVRSLAAFTQRSTPAQELAALERLDKVLNAKQKPPADLPRGHLLNIVI